MQAENIKTNWVIDASFTAPLFLVDEDSSRMEGFFNVAFQKIHKIFVPPLWWFEMNNIFRTSIKRQRMDSDQVFNAIEVLQGLQVIIEPIAFNINIFQLTQTYNLSAYDAAYIDLAIRYQAGLATLDKDLTAAARRLDIAVWS